MTDAKEEIHTFAGNRMYFYVPVAIAGIIGFVGLLLLMFAVLRGMSAGWEFSLTSHSRTPAIDWLLISVAVLAGAGWVLKLADSTYVETLRLDDSGVYIRRPLTGSKTYPWSDIKRTHSDETALCLVFHSNKSLDVGACLQDFELLRHHLKEMHKARKPEVKPKWPR